MSCQYPGIVSESATTTLETLRNEKGLSRAAVAAVFDISERHLYRLEKGQQTLSRIQAIAFAEFYDVDPDELWRNAA